MARPDHGRPPPRPRLISSSKPTREPDPADTRARLVRLTPAGRELERQISHAIAKVLDSWEDELGAERFDALWSTLQQLTGETAPLPDRDLIRLDGD